MSNTQSQEETFQLRNIYCSGCKRRLAQTNCVGVGLCRHCKISTLSVPYNSGIVQLTIIESDDEAQK